MNKKLSYSFDEENYYGEFDTIEELVNELLDDSDFTDRIEENENSLIISIGENVPFSKFILKVYVWGKKIFPLFYLLLLYIYIRPS